MVASRLFRLRPQSEELTIHQRIERTGPSDIPVVLWNVSQIANAQQIILPTDPQSHFPKGLKTLMGGKPPRGSVKKCDAAAIYTVRPGAETKLGSDSPRAWIAATKDETLIVETAVTAATPAGAPTTTRPDTPQCDQASCAFCTAAATTVQVAGGVPAM